MVHFVDPLIGFHSLVIHVGFETIITIVKFSARKIVQFLFCNPAFVVARMFHNKIWGIEAFVWVFGNAKNQQEALER